MQGINARAPVRAQRVADWGIRELDCIISCYDILRILASQPALLSREALPFRTKANARSEKVRLWREEVAQARKPALCGRGGIAAVAFCRDARSRLIQKGDELGTA